MDMPTVVVEELHVTVRMPADLPDDEADRVRRALTGFPALAATRIAVSR